MESQFAAISEISSGCELLYAVEVSLDYLFCFIDCMLDYILVSCGVFGCGEGGIAYVGV